MTTPRATTVTISADGQTVTCDPLRAPAGLAIVGLPIALARSTADRVSRLVDLPAFRLRVTVSREGGAFASSELDAAIVDCIRMVAA